MGCQRQKGHASRAQVMPISYLDHLVNFDSRIRRPFPPICDQFAPNRGQIAPILTSAETKFVLLGGGFFLHIFPK